MGVRVWEAIPTPAVFANPCYKFKPSKHTVFATRKQLQWPGLSEPIPTGFWLDDVPEENNPSNSR